MPFLRIHIKKNNKNSTANSLRAHLVILHRNVPIKRASSFTSRTLKGALTVEAAFALPLFLFCMIQMMSAINMIGTQSRLNAALHQTGNKMAFAGYAYEMAAGSVLPEEIASAALTEFYARNQIIDYVGDEYLEQSCIKGGAAGISFHGSSIMKQNDMIEICLSYQMQPLLALSGIDGLAFNQRYYGRAWTGYDVEGNVSDFTLEDPMVYITETGTVYHTNRNCTHLNLTVDSVNGLELETIRNGSGGKYYLCEICAGKKYNGMNAGNVFYITKEGNRYHSMITCSGLKRTVYTVPLSEVGGRGSCVKCR